MQLAIIGWFIWKVLVKQNTQGEKPISWRSAKSGVTSTKQHCCDNQNDVIRVLYLQDSTVILNQGNFLEFPTFFINLKYYISDT